MGKAPHLQAGNGLQEADLFLEARHAGHDMQILLLRREVLKGPPVRAQLLRDLFLWLTLREHALSEVAGVVHSPAGLSEAH